MPNTPKFLWVVAVGLLIFLIPVAWGAEPAKPPPADQPARTFAICYDPNVKPELLKGYDLVVVDFAYPKGDIAKLQGSKATVFGYLSIGKVHQGRPFFADAKKLNALAGADPNYKDVFFLNAGNNKWQAFVVDTLIPDMARTGFDGIFLDDLDNLHERKQSDAAVQLIAAIRKKHPHVKLMANRGLEYLKDFAPQVDYSLLESCFVEKGALRKPDDPAWALGHLKAGLKANPKLIGCAVDYFADKPTPKPSDKQKELIAEVQRLHREHNLLSCVTAADLQGLPAKSGK